MATESTPQGSTAELDAAAVVQALLDVLGERLVAVTAGVNNAAIVRQWARSQRVPPPETQRRLLAALQVVELLLEQEGPSTIRAWWIGMNPDLGEQAPALVLAEQPEHVLAAARAFLAQ